MPITLGSNIAALLSQRRLGEASSAASSALERLSSGLRINRASDDPAGSAIAASLHSDARVFAQALRNANDAISFLNVAEGALRELSNVVTRQQELATQAANGAYSFNQRKALHTEANALTDEYNRIIASTSFNGIKMLDGSGTSLSVQLGYGASGNITAAVGVDAARTTGDGTFATAVNKADGSATVYDTAAADYNGDGNLDYALVYSTAAQIFLGNGDGSFNGGTAYTVAAGSHYSLSQGDINRDGYLDLITPNSTGTNFSVLLGNANGSFSAYVSYASGIAGGLNRSYLGDVNGDGYLDAISTGLSGTQRIGVALANSNGSFKAGSDFAAGVGGTDTLAVADYNNDGRADIAVGDFTAQFINVFLSAGDGTFASAISVGTPGAIGGRTFAGDVNNDGNMDILGTDTTGTGSVHVLLGNGNGSFSHTRYSSIGADPVNVTFADFNGDGINDIATSDNGGAFVNVLLNNGNGTFGASRSFATTGGFSNAITSGDFNKDGAADIVAPNFGVAQASLLFGNTRQTTTIAHLDLTSQAAARAALSTTQSSLTRITQELGKIGAFQARLESATRTLADTRANYLAAASHITDVDVAAETSRLVAARIRQQAAAAILAQANQQPDIALRLLGSAIKRRP